MPRLPRRERPGGVHHVFNHAVTGGVLFRDDGDRHCFLRELTHAVVERRWQCLAFCLLDNHFHLLLETPAADLGLGMQRIEGRHAQRFRQVHGGRGAVYESRFKSVPVERETYLFQLFRYVALNPVNAGLCADPAEYRWSSHRGTLLRQEDPLHASMRVRQLLEAGGGVHRDPYEDLFDAHGPFASWDTEAAPLPPRPTIAALLCAHPRDEALRLAMWEHGYRIEELAEAIGCSTSTISNWTRGQSNRDASSGKRGQTPSVRAGVVSTRC